MPADRGTTWSLTCNLKNISRSTVESCISNAQAQGWGVQGQIEQGEEGTQHYQLMLKTPQVRFSAVKKVFPTAHIELARNAQALQQYVHKEESRVEEFKTIENAFVTWKTVRDKFFEWYVQNYDVEFPPTDDQKLMYYDKFIGISIAEGMEVDLIGVNPQYRSCILRYWDSYIRRQTDRQTDKQEVSLPTIS